MQSVLPPLCLASHNHMWKAALCGQPCWTRLWLVLWRGASSRLNKMALIYWGWRFGRLVKCRMLQYSESMPHLWRTYGRPMNYHTNPCLSICCAKSYWPCFFAACVLFTLLAWGTPCDRGTQWIEGTVNGMQVASDNSCRHLALYIRNFLTMKIKKN